MSNMIESITVDAPAHEVYPQWNKLQVLVEFMDGVRDVERYPNGLTRWTIAVDNELHEFDAEILQVDKARRIVWASLDGPQHSGSVEFEPIKPDMTRVTARVHIDLKDFPDKNNKMDVLNDKIREDLELFRDYVVQD